MAREKVQLLTYDDKPMSPITIASNILFEDGKTAQDILSEIQETSFTPIIENSSQMFGIGEGNNVDYSENVVDGAYESCVLKGRTLVNLFKTSKLYVTANKNIWHDNSGNKHLFKSNTIYTLHNLTNKQINIGVYTKDPMEYKKSVQIPPNSYKTHFLEGESFFYQIVGELSLGWTENDGEELKRLVITEGANEFDISYFEGMCSVRTPTVANVGANIFNFKDYRPYKASYSLGFPHETKESVLVGLQLLENGFTFTTTSTYNNQGVCYYVKVKKNTDYYISCDVEFSDTYSLKAFGMYTSEIPLTKGIQESKRFLLNLDNYGDTRVKKTFNTGEFNCLFIYLGGSWVSNPTVAKTTTFTNVQIKEKQTDYEPYKLNITTFEQEDKEIVLRSIPNGECDTLDVENKKLTQIIEHIVFDGTEKWVEAFWNTNDEYLALEIDSLNSPKLKDIWNKSAFINFHCNSFKVLTNVQWNYMGEKHIRQWSDGKRVSINVIVPKTDLKTADVTGFKEYLSNNNIVIDIERSVPLVHEIDVQGFPYAYKDGRVVLSGEAITPVIEYSLPINQHGQINTNQKMVEKHQKQIDSLQVMMIANMVNTHYRQTLTKLSYRLGDEFYGI